MTAGRIAAHPEWFVRLEGDQADLVCLAESMQRDSLNIRVGEDGTYLRAAVFQALDDSQAVRDCADVLVRLLSGACRLGLGSQHAIRVACVHRSRPDGGPADTFVRVDALTIRSRVMAPTITIAHPDGTTEVHHPADPLAAWMELAIRESAAAKLLRLLDVQDPDFVDLYRIFELIEENAGQSSITKRGWCSKKAITLFTRTANSPAAIGDRARHGREHTKPPSSPMPLAEARTLIHNLAECWLKWKIAKGGAHAHFANRDPRIPEL